MFDERDYGPREYDEPLDGYSDLNLDIISEERIRALTGDRLYIAVNKSRGFAVVEFVDDSKNGTIWKLLDKDDNVICVADEEYPCWKAAPTYETRADWFDLVEELRVLKLDTDIKAFGAGWLIFITPGILDGRTGYEGDIQVIVYSQSVPLADLGDNICQSYLIGRKFLRNANPFGLIDPSSRQSDRQSEAGI